ncbi:MAG: M24 family metallopeptidase, partial [Gammaproteobacteria bacterium]|nr:M24 family metallopeptidase [Gammaproteobacteria bacterium]
SRTFMPHGLGHLLGVQTHDVGGWQTTPEGSEAPPPDAHATLRLTRTIEAGMVFTIEPGLYFIPMLLSRLRKEANAREVNWPQVESMTPWGGARIEDNVLVMEGGARNLTREAFAALDST